MTKWSNESLILVSDCKVNPSTYDFVKWTLELKKHNILNPSFEDGVCNTTKYT